MKKRDWYRDRAFECILAAQDIRDPVERIKLLTLAQHWIRLADHVIGHLDKGTPHRQNSQPKGAQPDS